MEADTWFDFGDLLFYGPHNSKWMAEYRAYSAVFASPASCNFSHGYDAEAAVPKVAYAQPSKVKDTRWSPYHRLTEGEVDQVYAMKKAGVETQLAPFADQICVNKSTSLREL